jgi:hypothetical protein
MIIMGLLQYRVVLIMFLVDLFGNWAGFILFSLICTLVFSSISLNKKRIKITVDGDGGMTILHGNGVLREYNLFDTAFVFQKETGGGIFHAVAFTWVIKATDVGGNTEKIYAYAFRKHDFLELSQYVEQFLMNLDEEPDEELDEDPDEELDEDLQARGEWD